MTAAEYAEVERQIGDGTPLGDVAFELPWVLDGLDPAAAATVLRMVPAPVRLLHRVVLRRRYERLAEPIRAVRARTEPCRPAIAASWSA